VNIRGFIETSLLDWDGKVASVIFLPHCNFLCPFCNNGILVAAPEALPEIKVETVEDFIRERKDFIDGVVITGGEPTIHPWLPELARRLKALGVLVKLDTNGTNPELLSELLNSKLIDYIAMDLKAPLSGKYHEAAGVNVDLRQITASIELIMNSGLDYEFRTTVVPTLHEAADIEAMARSIKGAKKFVLQQFVPDHTLDENLRTIKPYPKEKMQELAALARKFVPQTVVRGI